MMGLPDNQGYSSSDVISCQAENRRSGQGHSQPEGRVLTFIDLNAELAKLRMLRGRTPETPAAEREGAFARLAPYRDGAIFTGKFAGNSAWERHPNGDEIVQIVDGATVLHVMAEDGPESFALGA